MEYKHNVAQPPSLDFSKPQPAMIRTHLALFLGMNHHQFAALAAGEQAKHLLGMAQRDV